MKRKILWIVAGLVLIAVGVTAARASFGRGRGWCGHGWHHRGPLGFVARDLKLSDAQISAVGSIWTEERPAVASLLKEMLDGAHQMADATAGGKTDDDKVHAIAAAEGNNFARLLVERERIKSRIYATVLNDEQKQSADRLQQRMLDRLDRAVSRLEKQ